MPKGVYVRTEEHKRNISEGRKRYYDEHGRVVEIDQREDYASYQREYQKIYRQTHKEYYKAYAKKRWLEKKNQKNLVKVRMTKLNDAQNLWNEIVTSAIANEYNKFEKQTDIMPLVEKLHEMLIKYANEVKEEKEQENEVQ
jgi:hypothetical protein